MSHAVDEAVAARSSVLSPRADPVSVAAHVLGSMAGYLPGVFDCAEEELGFLTRTYRWSRLADVLDAACAADSGSGPRHPRSDGWASVYGREIPTETVGAQAAAVRRWLDADISDAEVRRNVALGMRAPGALERAVGRPSRHRNGRAGSRPC